MTFKQLLDYYSDKCLELNKEISSIKILLLDYFKIDNTQLYLKYHEHIKQEDLDSFIELANKYLLENIPVQYIIGYTYFYNLKIKVNKNVLIPRFETELLVEEVIKRVSLEDKIDILDIGTGSGCIALALKANLPNTNILAIDISQEALNVAQENAKINQIDVQFLQSDIFSNIPNFQKFDIIVSNPPYIGINDEVDSIVINNEPHLALFAKEDGLYFYQQILQQAPNYLKPKSMLAFEIGYNQKEALEALINKYFPNSQYEFVKDFNHIDRIVFIYQDAR